jgi:hypothetical protein
MQRIIFGGVLQYRAYRAGQRVDYIKKKVGFTDEKDSYTIDKIG